MTEDADRRAISDVAAYVKQRETDAEAALRNAEVFAKQIIHDAKQFADWKTNELNRDAIEWERLAKNNYKIAEEKRKRYRAAAYGRFCILREE